MENNSWNPENQWSVQKDAGNRLDATAKYLMKRDGLKYPEALKVARHENPQTDAAYQTGIREAPKDYRLSEGEKRMIELQNDPDQVMFLAGNILNTHAQRLAGSVGRGSQVNKESFASALRELMSQYPNLGTAYNSGFISASDWSLLATLVPGVSSEVKSRHGAEPLNLRSGNYSERSGVRKYDNRGEYRCYVR